MITLPSGWRWLKLRCKPQPGCGRMLPKRIWRAHNTLLRAARLCRRPRQSEIARRALPNDPRLFQLTGYILRRRGQQKKGCRTWSARWSWTHATFIFCNRSRSVTNNWGAMPRRSLRLDRALAIVPDNVETRAARGVYYICWKADTRPLHQTIDAILAQGPGAIASAADIWFFCALAERDPAAAERALVALGENPCWSESHDYSEPQLW